MTKASVKKGRGVMENVDRKEAFQIKAEQVYSRRSGSTTARHYQNIVISSNLVMFVNVEYGFQSTHDRSSGV